VCVCVCVCLSVCLSLSLCVTGKSIQKCANLLRLTGKRLDLSAFATGAGCRIRSLGSRCAGSVVKHRNTQTHTHHCVLVCLGACMCICVSVIHDMMCAYLIPLLQVTKTCDTHTHTHTAVMGLFGKSGLQGPPTRVALLLRDIQLRLCQWGYWVLLFTIWDSVAGPGRTPMPTQNSGLADLGNNTVPVYRMGRPPGRCSEMIRDDFEVLRDDPR
jgi:hypothetical protein